MELDKKQLPQLIVLGVLVLVSVGYISFKIAAPKAAPKPAAKTDAQAPAGAVSDTAAADAESEALALLPPGEFPNLFIMPARRDPFTPQRMPGAEDCRLVQASVSTTAPKSKPNNIFNPFDTGKNGSQKVPSFDDIFGGPKTQQPATVRVLPFEAPEEKDPEFVLTGVVRGEQNVAIIRVGQDGRYVVKEGQFIDGRYRVKSVTDDGAVLVYKNRSIYLKLGGVTNAS